MRGRNMKKKKKKPQGKIIVTSITQDLIDMLPDNPSDMTEEEIHAYAKMVFSKLVSYEGDEVDTSKLAKDYDPDELTYDPDTVI
jgi:hypothetical protein